jgi:hypothetical protein
MLTCPRFWTIHHFSNRHGLEIYFQSARLSSPRPGPPKSPPRQRPRAPHIRRWPSACCSWAAADATARNLPGLRRFRTPGINSTSGSRILPWLPWLKHEDMYVYIYIRIYIIMYNRIVIIYVHCFSILPWLASTLLSFRWFEVLYSCYGW